MPLRDQILIDQANLANDKDTVNIDYQYLDAQATALLKGKIAKPARKDALEKVVFRISKTAEVNTCARLSGVLNLTAGVWFNNAGKNKPLLPKTNALVKAFIEAFLLFDPDDPNRKLIDEYVANPPDGQLPGLSTAFTDKHFATGDPQATEKATDRYNNSPAENKVTVSTFLYPNDAVAFNHEVVQCAPFLKALWAYLQSKDARYRGRNKRVADLVIRSSAKYTMAQCTNNNNFVPYQCQEYVYYGIGTPAGEVVCDHYVKKAGLVQGQGLAAGWKKLDLTKVPNAAPPLAIEVYLKYGTFD